MLILQEVNRNVFYITTQGLKQGSWENDILHSDASWGYLWKIDETFLTLHRMEEVSKKHLFIRLGKRVFLADAFLFDERKLGMDLL